MGAENGTFLCFADIPTISFSDAWDMKKYLDEVSVVVAVFFIIKGRKPTRPPLQLLMEIRDDLGQG